MSGTKRASPGADAEKNPLGNVELGDEDAKKLEEIQKEVARVEIVLERQGFVKLYGVYEKRRAVAKTIPKYWPVALMNHPMLAYHIQHSPDQYALSALEDVWVARDPREPRCFTIEFHFKENPYFTDKLLTKEFKYVPPPTFADEKPDADGIVPSALDFSWERDVEPSSTTINWTSPDKQLTKLYPRIADTDEETDLPAESGSFFNWFEIKDDPFEIGMLIANEIFPDATDFFLGQAGGDDLDSDDEDEDSDDEGAEEIDLEKPKAKKQKKT
ncbi:hypothetical protein PLICRDRAFT_101925 [Plicaturopsis crispa FD-325 SS-3]|nr:hypothetical protein PLICRDRAFT_101925 [Plicaturopsis crispa FD-325 SS-3]